MTFEATDTRASAASADDTTAPAPRRRAALPPQWKNDAAEEMLGFVDKAAHIADDLRGLAKLLRGIFEVDANSLSVAEDAALRIVGECIESMATRLDAIRDALGLMPHIAQSLAADSRPRRVQRQTTLGPA